MITNMANYRFYSRPAIRPGFALREVIAVLFIIVLLLCVFVPWIVGTRAGSREELCLSRMKEVGFAMQAYDDREGGLPGYRNPGPKREMQMEMPAVGWVDPLFPYLAPGELDPMTKKFTRKPLARPHTNELRLPEVLCPDLPAELLEATPNRLSFVVNTGLPDAEKPEMLPHDWQANGAFFDRRPPAGSPDPSQSLAWIEQRDGLDYTLLVSENVDAGLWTDSDEAKVGFVWIPGFVADQPSPGDLQFPINVGVGREPGTYRAARPSAYHKNGANVIYASGRGQLLDAQIDYLAYAQVMSADGPNVRVAGSDELLPPPYRVEKEVAGSK